MEDRYVNYPIKYALLSMGEYEGLNGGEQNYNVCGYIVSKIYLTGTKIRYLSDGSYNIKYEVVFPYKSFDDLEKRNVPKFNLSGECYNFDTVLEIFDDINDAFERANELNYLLMRKYISNISLLDSNWKFNLINRQNDFNNRLKDYRMLEQIILEKSKDMENIENIEGFTQKIKNKKI